MQTIQTAFIFPGQGAQALKMLDAYGDFPIVKATLEEAGAILQQDFWQMLQAETPDAINATVNTQPLMLAAGVAVYRAWLAAGGAAPNFVAGHSLGEYTALVVAGAMTFEDALRLVHLRATAMQEAVPEGTGGMAAILGLSVETVRTICAQVADERQEVVQAVNLNDPAQTVIAGHKTAVEHAMLVCKEQGAKRALPLPVSVPSHCELMRPAAERLANALAKVTIAKPQIRVLHNADVACYETPDQIRDALVRQLYSPVRWTESVEYLAAQGVMQFVECAPSKVLSGLVKRIVSNAQTNALTDSATLVSVATVNTSA
jgi:[acyl-carrier-protein] S-malonyltransferase